MTSEQARLLSIVREVYGRLVWTHKTHEKQRELDSSRVRRERWLNVFLMGLSASGVLASIPLQEVWASVIAAVLAFVSTGFAIYQISFGGEAQILLQRQAAKNLLIERDNMLLFIEKVMMDDADIVLLREEFQVTQQRIGQIYASLPDTTSKAYELASKGLKNNEELTFSSDEIDLLLPEKLRNTQSNLESTPPN